MSVSVSIENSTNAMWFEVPGPADAETSAPGWRFASATRSRTDLAGIEGWMTNAFGVTVSRVTGARSRVTSYASFLYRLGLIASAVVPISRL